MSDAFADFTARLEQLLAAIMKEKRPEKCDELAAEIWRVLAESDSAKKRVNPKWNVGPVCQQFRK